MRICYRCDSSHQVNWSPLVKKYLCDKCRELLTVAVLYGYGEKIIGKFLREMKRR